MSDEWEFDGVNPDPKDTARLQLEGLLDSLQSASKVWHEVKASSWVRDAERNGYDMMPELEDLVTVADEIDATIEATERLIEEMGWDG